jgi:hypothetical protein
VLRKASLSRRFQAAFDAPHEELNAQQRDYLLSGLTAAGKALSVRQYQSQLDRTKTRIGYVDMTFSAPKSVSVAWAFAPTEAERAIIRQAHRDAIESVMTAAPHRSGILRRRFRHECCRKVPNCWKCNVKLLYLRRRGHAMTTTENGKPGQGGGGSATAGGVNFQAAATAIAAICMARGVPLDWLSGLTSDIPVSIAAESKGPGDDLRVTLIGGEIVEAQMKRGLRAGVDLWTPLMKLSKAIQQGFIQYGVLVVSNESSGTIRNDLARDIIRMGDGRSDDLRDLAEEFAAKLSSEGLDTQFVCSRLRIVTYHVDPGNNASVLVAKAELANLCKVQSQVTNAWDAIYCDSAGLMQYRGQRAASAVLNVLRSANIALRMDSTSPATIIAKLADWVHGANDTFSVFGVSKGIPIDTGWIPISVVIQGTESKAPKGLEEALEFYHNWNKREFSRDGGLVPETIGRFYRRCVVVAGPGMGKSTLVKKLARTYSQQSAPVLKVSLPRIATAMREQGLGFAEALFRQGLDGSGLSVQAVIDAGISNWVALCDGLDECGQYQEEIAQGVLDFTTGHPDSTIVVATRPIGYTTNLLEPWRHYEVLPLAADEERYHLSTMLESIYPDDVDKQGSVLSFALAEITKSKTNKTVTRSPLLLGLTLSLAVRGQPFGTSKEQLYKKIFDIIDEIPNSRNPKVPPQKPTLLRFLYILGWVLVRSPVSDVGQVLELCAKELAAETNATLLNARELSEQCSNYWQTVGILERVNHAGSEALTFIHKTFGEYAAGHYLARSTLDAQRALIPDLLQQPGMDEVLSFAGAMGTADILCDELLKRAAASDAGSVDVALALRLVAEAEPSPGSAVRKRVFESVADYLKSDTEDVAYRVAASLNSAMKRFLGELAPIVSPLRTNPQPWTRLAVWSALVGAGTEGYTFGEMAAAFATLPKETRSGVRGRLSGGLTALYFGGHELLDTFVLAAMERLLAEGEPSETDATIKAAFEIEALQGIWLVQKAHAVLKRHGRTFALAAGKVRDPGSLWEHMSTPEYKEANTRAYTKMIAPLAAGDFPATARPTENHLILVSAFFQLTSVWRISGSGIAGWADDALDEVAATVIRYVRDILDLEPVALAAEATEYVRRVNTPDGTGRLLVFDPVVHVDIPDIDWDRAQGRAIDPDILEKAVHHKTEWLLVLTANLLQQTQTPAELLPRLTRLIDAVRGTGLAVVAYLSKLLPKAEMHTLLEARLRKDAVPGCDFLFGALVEVPPLLNPAWREVLRINLLRKAPNTATGAAKFAATLAVAGDKALETLLWAAYDFWKQHEEPQPKGGGAVPASPRADILKALLICGNISDERLIEMAGDVRSDVRDTVKSIGMQRAASKEFAAALIESAANGKGGGAWISETLREKRPMDAANVAKLEALLQSADAKQRYFGMNILDAAYLAPDTVLKLATRLLEDPETDIRERAKRTIKSQPPADK